MPRLEGVVSSPMAESAAREAHAIRLRDRLAQYRQLLAQVPAAPTPEHPKPSQERALIQDAIARCEEQHAALEKLGPVVMAASDQENAALKDEVASLREALTEATMKLAAKTEAPRA